MAGEGQSYSEQEADEWLGQTGWRKLEREALPGWAAKPLTALLEADCSLYSALFCA